ncbi:electron transfer flavoprotein subunit beta/FixA family protein [Halanaerobium saccharolyticum]|nr:electron transfer flavoprotein subunit beta/FixA family protein [Halanaerobium saccharolyticum]
MGIATAVAFATGGSTIKSAIGTPYLANTIAIAVVIFLLTIFGAKLVREFATYIGIAIIIGVISTVVNFVFGGVKRIISWWTNDNTGRSHSIIASIIFVLITWSIARFGLIPLVARGYGFLGYLGIPMLILPVFYKLIKRKLGGSVTAISMGPQRAESALKEAARGADNVFLLTDNNFAGADTIATSGVLAAAAGKLVDFDLIIAGEMSVDGDTAQVGPQTAEFLDINHAAYVSDITSVSENAITVTTSLWEANYKKVFNYPLLLTVTKDLNDPRLPSFKDKMRARKIEVKKFDLEAIKDQLQLKEVGFKGSPTWVENIVVPQKIERKVKVYNKDETEKAIADLKEILKAKNLMEA